MFVALKGERFDAHDFLRQAGAQGAVAALAEQGLAEAGLPGLQVANSKAALSQLAAGWRAQFLSLHDGDELVAACPLYVKDHSYGEYVFDWAWADAYQRHGLDYYPKLLNAVPFTPVPGPRLLARDQPSRVALLRAMEQYATQGGLSSAHLLFLDDNDANAARMRAYARSSRNPDSAADVEVRAASARAITGRFFASVASVLKAITLIPKPTPMTVMVTTAITLTSNSRIYRGATFHGTFLPSS